MIKTDKKRESNYHRQGRQLSLRHGRDREEEQQPQETKRIIATENMHLWGAEMHPARKKQP